MTTTTPRTHLEADPALPTIRIVRDFDAPPERVYRAYTDPTLVRQWLGPKDTPTHIEHWDARTGGNYRYSSWRDGEKIASFYGSFHELRPDQRLVQTFTYEGAPDCVALETVTFDDL
ncbi:MAG: SRPBCC domain-containing protein, partial [Kutzneria sp.]|nr:SRPBCC domain-containing protein [Kutzneria sp.]